MMEIIEVPRERRCEACLLWDREEGGAHGRCRSEPPQMPDASGKGFWPITEKTDWCDKWKRGDE